MSTEAPAAPAKKPHWTTTLTPEQKAERAAKQSADMTARHAERKAAKALAAIRKDPASLVLPSAQVPVSMDPALLAEIDRLKAELADLKPKPVDLSKLPEFEVYCELGFCGKKDDQDNPIAETLRDPEDPRWNEIVDVKSVFPSLIVNRLVRDAAGNITERLQIRGRQARNTRVARELMREVVQKKMMDGAAL